MLFSIPFDLAYECMHFLLPFDLVQECMFFFVTIWLGVRKSTDLSVKCVQFLL